MSNRLHFSIYIIISAIIFLWALGHPYHNWDMLGYVASSKIFSGNNCVDAYNYTYDNLEKYTNRLTFDDLTKNDPTYRNTISNDSKLFCQQLPFYKIRIIYIFCILFLSKIGFNPFFASHFISAVCVFFSILILGSIVSNISKYYLFYIMFPIALIPFGLLKVARLSTPDGLAFLYMSILSILIFKNKYRTILVLIPLSVAIRTDMILIILAIGLIFCNISREYLKLYVLSAISATLLFLSINSYFNNYGWQTLFYFSFIKKAPNPADLHPIVNIYNYSTILLAGIKVAFHSTQVQLYFFIISILAYCHYFFPKKHSDGITSGFFLFNCANIIYFIFHFLLFPVVWSRFFISQYSIAIILLIPFLNNLTEYLIRRFKTQPSLS